MEEAAAVAAQEQISGYRHYYPKFRKPDDVGIFYLRFFGND